jgi:dihydroflavonol-4-reductase
MGAHGPGSWNEETSEFNLWPTKDHYPISKYLAEIEAFKFGAKGLPVVIVNPPTVFGTNDRRPTSSGRSIIDVAMRKVPAYFEGMTNIVDVEDVAYAQVAAMTKGRIGERYLLGNRNVTLMEFFPLIADIAGVPRSTRRCPPQQCPR